MKFEDELETWQVWGLDVLGNEEDEFEVNDRFKLGIIELKVNHTDQDIVDELILYSFLKSTVTVNDLVFDGDDKMIYIDEKKDGFMLFQLELLED